MAGRVTPTHFTLRLVSLPTRAALNAAHGVRTESHRLLTIVAAHVDGDLGTAVGWGECSALNERGYTNESAEGAFELLRGGNSFNRGEQPMASAALEMALIDADLKAANQTLADRLGTAGLRAPAGAVVGLGPIPSMLDQVEELAQAGYRRIKCKVAPGRISTPVEAIRSSFPELELHVDANASLRSNDLPTLLGLAGLGVTAIEQPFAVGNHALAARLVAETDLAVIADEAIRTADSVSEIAAHSSANAVAVKPSKLGGIEAATALLDQLGASGLRASIGGMLESGLGRHVLAAFAPLAVFSVTGDLSPAKRWLSEDPFPDITMRSGYIAAPSRPGIAGDPVLGRLDRHTVRHAIVKADNLTASVVHENI